MTWFPYILYISAIIYILMMSHVFVSMRKGSKPHRITDFAVVHCLIIIIIFISEWVDIKMEFTWIFVIACVAIIISALCALFALNTDVRDDMEVGSYDALAAIIFMLVFLVSRYFVLR